MTTEEMKSGISAIIGLFSQMNKLKGAGKKNDIWKYNGKEGGDEVIMRNFPTAQNFLVKLANDCVLVTETVNYKQFGLNKMINKMSDKTGEIKDYMWAKLTGDEESRIYVSNFVSYDESEPHFVMFNLLELKMTGTQVDIKEQFEDDISGLKTKIENNQKDVNKKSAWENVCFSNDNKPKIIIKLLDDEKKPRGDYQNLLYEYTCSIIKLKALYKYMTAKGSYKEKVWKKVEDLFEQMHKAEKHNINLGITMIKISELIFDDCKQIVLTGAPGTGKTFSAKEYVKWQMRERFSGTNKEFEDEWKKPENVFSNRWKMVQFHPSFDYTDFVEGIRPAKLKGEKQSSFVRIDGVFKKFCRDVVESEKGIKAKALLKSSYLKVPEPIKTTMQAVLNLVDSKEKVAEDKLAKAIDEARKAINNHANQGISASTRNILSDTLYAIEKKPNYYFIIDEINRADLSKVFGELMFCLEENYRGPENKITTQYSNLDTYEMVGGFAKPIEKDVFKDGFYIPENVIIIGTMNDIDRSVDTFDFALRRRFRWIKVNVDKELLVSTFRSMNKEPMVTDEQIQDYADRINNMNKVFEDYTKIFRTPKDYYVGPAYFEGLFKGQSMESIWVNKVEPLLNEYIRGRDAGNFIEEAKQKLFPIKKDTKRDKSSNDSGKPDETTPDVKVED